ncbi:MAG: nucleotide exchange factor GrpE [Ignavibacteriae bacterium]|nr:MAG: nucleotide exchange factor GrpE [Ignavibacteriota bacterium]
MEKNDLEKKTNGSEKEHKPEAPLQNELTEPAAANTQAEELQKQIDQYKDMLLRKAAEFDNFKRRIENETSNIVKFATEALIDDLLPVLDDFERSLKHSKEVKDPHALFKGVEMIYQKFVKVLEGRGLKTFETVGKEFSVDYHDALMQLPRKDLPPHTVIEEVEKGYMLNDKVIRHAKVVVSSVPAEEGPEPGRSELSDNKSKD